ncbi:MAG: acylneuraminate cytidylyltransferase family protein [Natronospirillum sp.]
MITRGQKVQKVIAFVFARGGSKGVLRKNVRMLVDKPLLYYSIDLAHQLPEIDDIYVSTEDSEIADLALQRGAKVVPRPAEMATDKAEEWQAWQHAVQYVQTKGVGFDVFISLPTTSPLRSRADIEQCLYALNDQVDMVVTASESARNPYFNMVTVDDVGHCRPVIAGYSIANRQQAPKTFDLTTLAYVTTPKFILSAGGVLEGVTKLVEVPRSRALDIDTEYDLKLAEMMIKHDI